MKYYFCEEIPYENTVITEYETLEELETNEAYYITKETRYYIIKGEEINFDVKGD